MGGSFINLDLDAGAEGTGGYARDLGEDRAQRQRNLLAPHVAAADVLITTAAIPGRPAPLLVTTDMLAGMRAGSVVIDLAAESGGNVEGVVAGRDVQYRSTAAPSPWWACRTPRPPCRQTRPGSSPGTSATSWP